MAADRDHRGMMSARFMGIFEHEIALNVLIPCFVPLIQATGGNVGIQSSSLVLQSLANPGFLNEALVKRLAKVFSVAVLNGLFLSVIVLGMDFLIYGNTPLNLIVSIALFCVVLFASFVGTTTPLLLNSFGFNPALASGPFITTINDLLGLAIYFLIIHLLL